MANAGSATAAPVTLTEAYKSFESCKGRLPRSARRDRALSGRSDLPKMNGKDAVAEMRKTRQGLKVVSMSGYTADIILKRTVRAVLDA